MYNCKLNLLTHDDNWFRILLLHPLNKHLYQINMKMYYIGTSMYKVLFG